MRKNLFLVSVLLVLSVLYSGCTGSSSTSQNPPTVSNLLYAPNQANLVSGGTVTVTAMADATDIDGNPDTVTITTYDPSGNAIHTSTEPIPSASGHTSIPVLARASIDTSIAGCYSFRIFVTDSSGLKSNELAASLSIPFGACNGAAGQEIPMKPSTI